jgi:hypothetical protein
MREFALSVSRYSRTIPARLLASVLIFAVLTQAYWIALTLRLMGAFNPDWQGDTPAQLDMFAARSALHEFGALFVLAALALVLAGIPYRSGLLLGAVVAGTCLLGYFATEIPLPASPIAADLSSSLAKHVSDGIGHYSSPLVVIDLIAALPLCILARRAIKRAVHKARLPKGIEDTASGSSIFVVLNIRTKCAASTTVFLTLAACLSLLTLMRSTLGVLQPQRYAETSSASTWLLCMLFLLLASSYVAWPYRQESRRRVLALFLIGAPVLALWPQAIVFPVPGQFPSGPNAFWISIVAYPLVAAIGYASMSRILRLNAAA